MPAGDDGVRRSGFGSQAGPQLIGMGDGQPLAVLFPDTGDCRQEVRRWRHSPCVSLRMRQSGGWPTVAGLHDPMGRPTGEVKPRVEAWNLLPGKLYWNVSMHTTTETRQRRPTRRSTTKQARTHARTHAPVESAGCVMSLKGPLHTHRRRGSADQG